MQGVSVEENPESGAESRQATFSQLLDDLTRLYVRYMSLPHMLTKRLAFGPGPLSRLDRLVNGLEQLQLQQAGCKVGFWFGMPVRANWAIS